MPVGVRARLLSSYERGLTRTNIHKLEARSRRWADGEDAERWLGLQTYLNVLFGRGASGLRTPTHGET